MRTVIKAADYEDGIVRVIDDGPQCSAITLQLRGVVFNNEVLLDKALVYGLAIQLRKHFKAQGLLPKRLCSNMDYALTVESEHDQD